MAGSWWHSLIPKLRQWAPLLVVAPVALYLMCQGEQRSSSGSDPTETIIVLHEEGYVPVKPSQEPVVPEYLKRVLEDAPIAATILGDGYVSVCDTTLRVSLSLVKPEGCSSMLKVTVGDSVVVFNKLEEWMAIQGQETGLQARIVPEAVLMRGKPELGIGLSIDLFSIGSVHVGPAVTVGNLWVAVEGRGWVYLTRHLSLDGAAGYRFIEEPGLHLAVGIGLDL